MAFNGEFLAGTKIVTDNKILEQIPFFSNLGSDALYPKDECLRNKMNGYDAINVCGTLGRTLKDESGRGRQLISLRTLL